jgi:hypothetical protein
MFTSLISYLRRNLLVIILFAILAFSQAFTWHLLFKLSDDLDYLWWRTLKQPHRGE